MADQKKMSVAEILAAARKNSAQPAGAAPAKPAAETPPPVDDAPVMAEAVAEETSPAAASPKPAAKPQAGGARPNVKDILAMARTAKAGAPVAEPATKAAVEKPVAKPAVAKSTDDKPAAKPAAKPAIVGAKDTASILAAARKGAKPGPVTKAEAAAVATKAPPKAVAKEKLFVPPVPAKPEYAKPKPAKKADDVDRRGFFTMLLDSPLAIGMTSLAVIGGLWTLGTARFMFPNILTEPPSRFKVGFSEGFSPGQVETKFVAQFGVWVVNSEFNGQQQIFALKTVCTHLGCTPNWLEGEQKFKCPCHGSGFYKDGINFEGPAPRPLERYAIREGDDGQIEIDKSKTFQEELGQWADPASFVPV